jgi:hypothetical protein
VSKSIIKFIEQSIKDVFVAFHGLLNLQVVKVQMRVIIISDFRLDRRPLPLGSAVLPVHNC